MAKESIESQWHSLSDKYKELDVLRAKLDRSMLIQKLWIDSFKHGKCKSYFKGGSITYHDRFREVQFVIENGIGETKTFELKDVPDQLIHRLIMIQIDKANCRSTKHAIENFYKWYCRKGII
ncbi:unnamed protein product [marine sediment metagenome]|uniref:Uncharacterized protein n=1 Tax=marine sediment metagenome TaxID=412755 RepID=X0W125_9ZZZZ